jgi:hypothetical protein
MLPDPKLSRRFSRRTPHARCLNPDCRFACSAQLAPLTAAVTEDTEDTEDTAHRVDVVQSTSAIYALAPAESYTRKA